MSKQKPKVNWFYGIVLVVGILFTLTTCAYGWMLYLSTRAYDPATPRIEDSPLMQFMDEFGMYLILGQLLILTICTFGAFAVDSSDVHSSDRESSEKERSENHPSESGLITSEQAISEESQDKSTPNG